MKNKLLLALAVAASATSATFADRKDFTIDQSNVIVPFESGDYDYNIYYSGTENTRARLGVANALPERGYTVRSLKFNAGDGSATTTPSQWNLLGCFTLNIPDASGEYTVLDNQSGKAIHYQMGALTIKNADAASTATAKIEMGSAHIYLQGGGAKDQTPTLNIDTSTVLNSTHGTQGLLLSFSSILNVNGSSVFTINNKLAATGDDTRRNAINVAKDATLSVAGANLKNSDMNIEGKLNTTESITLDNVNMQLDGLISTTTKKTISIKNGTTVTGNGFFNMNTATTIDDTSSVDVRAISTGAGFWVTVNGSLTVHANTTFNNLTVNGTLQQLDGTATAFNRSATFGAGSSFKTVANNVTINAGTTSAAYTTLTIDADNKSFVVGTENAKIDIKRGTIIIEKEQAIRDANGGLVSISTLNGTSNAEFMVNASNDFATISAIKNHLNIYIAEGAVLKASFAASDGGKIILYDFVDNSVFVNNWESIDDLSTIFEAYKTIDGTEVKIDKLYCNNGWLSSTAIPEPAEWAAIFGAVALAAAIYRRRK